MPRLRRITGQLACYIESIDHMTYGQWVTMKDNLSAAKRFADSHVCYLGRRKTASSIKVHCISVHLLRFNIHDFLRIAPKPIARHLVLSAQDVIPTLDPLVPPAADTARTHQNPPRQSYPKEVLKHRFMPYGSLIASADATSAHEMAINMEVDGEKGIEMGDETLGKKLKESKGKKRKVEGDTPKKSKKAKTTV